MLLNCGVAEDSWESLRQKGDPTSSSILKEISPEYSLEGMMLKLKLQYFGHLMWRKDHDAGKDGRQEEKWMPDDEMVWWQHGLDEHEFEEALEAGDGQGSLVCCSPKGREELDMTEQLNWILFFYIKFIHSFTKHRPKIYYVWGLELPARNGESMRCNCFLGVLRASGDWQAEFTLNCVLSSPFGCREIQSVHSKGDQSWGVHWKDWCWSWNSNTLATWCEELTHWKRAWCWERLTAGGEGDDRGWVDWMASLTQQTWVWVDSGSWWWTGRPGVLQSMGLQRVRHV